MKQAKTNLRQAIKANYTTEPLTTNLSVAVADRIFGKQAAYSSLHEKWYYILIGILSVAAQDSTGQQQADPTGAVITQTTYDPHLQKIIPDKVFEFGVPFLLIFLLLNTVVSFKYF